MSLVPFKSRIQLLKILLPIAFSSYEKAEEMDSHSLTEITDKLESTTKSFFDANQELEKAGRVADFLEFAELFVDDALHRDESCGGHFREESQTEEGEAKRDDENYCYAAAWEFAGVGEEPKLHKESLEFEYVKLTQRSYK